MKVLKEQIQEKKAAHGCWLNMGSNISAEIVGQCGFDWVLIDLEHGAGDESKVYQQLQALASSVTTPIVRIAEISRAKVQHMMDAGAMGIMVPQVQTPEEAREAIRAMYYPPKGTRGMAKTIRATAYGTKFEEYKSTMEEKLLGIIQIETPQALESVDAIAAIDGVDVLFVGPSDLSLSLGIFNQLSHPLYQEAIKKVSTAAKDKQKSAGVLLFNIDEYEMYYKIGFRFFALGSDSSFVKAGARNTLQNLKTKSDLFE